MEEKRISFLFTLSFSVKVDELEESEAFLNIEFAVVLDII